MTTRISCIIPDAYDRNGRMSGVGGVYTVGPNGKVQIIGEIEDGANYYVGSRSLARSHCIRWYSAPSHHNAGGGTYE